MPGNKVNDQIIYKPDKTYGLEQKLERFELPYSATESPMFPIILEKAAKQTARLAAEKYEKIGHHWRSDLPVSVDESELQVSLYEFGSTSANEFTAQDSGTVLQNKYDRIAYVVKMWYVVPQIRVEVFDNDELAESEGFVEELPDSETIEENL